MSWNSFPQSLKERYERISTVDYGPIKMSLLEEMNKDFLPLLAGMDSDSYEIFANQFNSTMLFAHLFENTMELEDGRLKVDGYDNFEIKIPEAYFRHPSIDQFSPLSDHDIKEISSVVSRSRERLNYSKDLSFILSQLHKQEFISIFSYLEAYTESLMVEFLGVSKKDAAAKVRREQLPTLFKNTLDEIDPRIIQAINLFDSEALNFITFCRELRNLHTHNLGIVTRYFYDNGLSSGFLHHDINTESATPAIEYARLSFKYCDYIFEVGRCANLSTLSQPFRLLCREIVYIAEAFLKEKINKGTTTDRV
ncbi:hypothetical protein LRS56_05030 [Pseudomonas poae]|nr:hypothetical protein LRS56_05030 [Pseudomonas poae]